MFFFPKNKIQGKLSQVWTAETQKNPGNPEAAHRVALSMAEYIEDLPRENQTRGARGALQLLSAGNAHEAKIPLLKYLPPKERRAELDIIINHARTQFELKCTAALGEKRKLTLKESFDYYRITSGAINAALPGDENLGARFSRLGNEENYLESLLKQGLIERNHINFLIFGDRPVWTSDRKVEDYAEYNALMPQRS